MKSIYWIGLVIVLSSSLYAADSTLVFRNIPYEQLYKTARQENKLIFLYFHFNGCGACVKMEKTAFVDTKVADFMNTHFVNYTINTLEGDGIEINKNFHVRTHPTFMILDEKENILHKWVGVFDPGEFIAQAQQAMEGTSRYADFVKQYKNGNRDPDFLFRYAYVLRDAYELPVTVIQEYIATQTGDALYEEKNLKFISEFALHNFEIGVPFHSEAYHLMFDHRDLFTPYMKKEQVDVRLLWIANRTAQQATETLNDTLFQQALAVVKQFPTGKWYEYHELDGRMTGIIMEKNIPLTLEMAYDRKKGNMEEYYKKSKEYIESIWDDPDALNERAWSVCEDEVDPAQIQEALGWAKRSIQLHSEYANHDTYAALLYKSGNYKKARKEAEKAISLAIKEEEDYTETSALLEKINEHMVQN